MKLHHPIYIMSVGIAIVCTGPHLYLQQLEVKHVHHCYAYFSSFGLLLKSVNSAVYPSCHLECKVNAQWQLCKHQASNVPWIRAIVTSQIGQVPFFVIYYFYIIFHNVLCMLVPLRNQTFFWYVYFSSFVYLLGYTLHAN